MAQDAHEIFQLERVLFVPDNKPPHKDHSLVISAAHRLAMLQAALGDNPAFEICDLELQRSGTTYSVDTVQELIQRHANTPMAFIIGTDTLLELHLWKDIYTLLELCGFITLARPGFDLKSIQAAQLKLAPPWPQKLLNQMAVAHSVNLSSTDIRARVSQAKSIRYLVPPAVESYIVKHKLYQTA